MRRRSGCCEDLSKQPRVDSGGCGSGSVDPRVYWTARRCGSGKRGCWICTRVVLTRAYCWATWGSGSLGLLSWRWKGRGRSMLPRGSGLLRWNAGIGVKCSDRAGFEKGSNCRRAFSNLFRTPFIIACEKLWGDLQKIIRHEQATDTIPSAYIYRASHQSAEK